MNQATKARKERVTFRCCKLAANSAFDGEDHGLVLPITRARENALQYSLKSEMTLVERVLLEH
jgi:hypothetical protein